MNHLYNQLKANKTLSLAVLLLLIITIPTTVLLTQKVRETRQHADAFLAVMSVTPAAVSFGEGVSISWTINPANRDSLTGAEYIKSFRQECSGPREDCAINNAAPAWTAYGPEQYLSCNQMYTGTDTDPHTPPGSPIFTGTCTYTIPQDAPPGKYMFRIMSSDGVEILGESKHIRVGIGDPVTEVEVPPSISAWPNPCMLTDYGTCSSIISWNVPDATDAASVTVKIKGINNSPFANAPYGTKKAGWITRGGATFELYVGSATLPVASVFVNGLDLTNPPFEDGGIYPMDTRPEDGFTYPTSIPRAIP